MKTSIQSWWARPAISRETKIALHRWTLRQLRKLVDATDEWLHTAEVRLRNDLSDLRDRQHPPRAVPRTEDMLHQATDEWPESEICGIDRVSVVDSTPQRAGSTPASRSSFEEWEARRSGIAPISKRAARARRQRPSASAFDMRYAR